MNSKLRAMRAEVAAKREALHNLHQEAGGADELDLSKIKSLGDIDDNAKLHELRKRHEEIDRLTKAATDYAAVVEAAKRQEVEDAAEERAKADGDDTKTLTGEDAEAKSLGEIVTESAAFKAFTANKAGMHGSDEPGEAAIKATFATGAGWAPETIRIPGLVIPFAVQEPMVVDVVPSAMTSQAAVVYMEENARANAGRDAAAERAEEGEYVESTYSLVERSQTVRSIGHRVPVTDEQLEDVPAVRSYLDSRLTDGLRRRLSYQLLNGAGTGVLLRGLLTATSVTENQAASPDSPHDTIFRAIIKIATGAFSDANVVILHPNNWRDIRLQRYGTAANQGGYLFGNPDVRGVTTVWGIPRVLSTEIAEDLALTGDFMQCAFYTRRGVEVQVGYVNDDFSKGRVTIRAGMRGAMVTYRPTAFVKSTLQ